MVSYILLDNHHNSINLINEDMENNILSDIFSILNEIEDHYEQSVCGPNENNENQQIVLSRKVLSK